ncbi:hypothetical protein [uncultured Brevundimonas sp.]|uniref:hypothetical protein n=1 Tax=uncultured Brevundimonas sp. TaxID=213418 RepID=UPI0025DCC81D|nr:hypothetical protein [uncultured Brevundimonas sp.]
MTDRRDQFLIERYKFILEQKRQLNANTFKVVAIFQALSLAIIGAVVALVTQLGEGKVDVHLAVYAARFCAGLMAAVGVFAALVIVSGLSAWINYRADEAQVEAEVFGSARAQPSWRDAPKWYETYILLAIFAFTVTVVIAVLFVVVPYIRT